MKGRLRLFTALGPGDIVSARRKQRSQQVINETSIAFSEQILAYCYLAGIKTLAISSNRRIDSLRDAEITLENRPKVFAGSGGIRFHLSQIFYGVYLAFRARLFNADIAIIDSGTSHYFALISFRVLGIFLFPSICIMYCGLADVLLPELLPRPSASSIACSFETLLLAPSGFLRNANDKFWPRQAARSHFSSTVVKLDVMALRFRGSMGHSELFSQAGLRKQRASRHCADGRCTSRALAGQRCVRCMR